MIGEEIRVLVVDEHAQLRAALGDLPAASGITVVGIAGDAEGAVVLARATQPAVAIVDARIPGAIDAFQAVTRIREASPGTRVVEYVFRHDTASIRAERIPRRGVPLADRGGGAVARGRARRGSASERLRGTSSQFLTYYGHNFPYRM